MIDHIGFWSILVAVHFFTSFVQTTCYFPDGSVPGKDVGDYQPCNSTAGTAGSACCDMATSTCTTAGYCAGNAGYLYRGGCTIQNFQSPNCAAQCLNGEYAFRMSCGADSDQQQLPKAFSAIYIRVGIQAFQPPRFVAVSEKFMPPSSISQSLAAHKISHTSISASLSFRQHRSTLNCHPQPSVIFPLPRLVRVTQQIQKVLFLSLVSQPRQCRPTAVSQQVPRRLR